MFILFSVFVILCFILFHFNQHMLLLFIVLILDGITNLFFIYFILFDFIILYYHTNYVTDVIVTRSDIIDHLLFSWFRCYYQHLSRFVTYVIVSLVNCY